MEVFLVLDNDGSHDPGRLVYFLANGDALNHVTEFDPARSFR